ncbi:hypothetical protein PF004_g28863 [Phytophthora fragariae]|uniref:Uncharacterized protein n=1 Tax=Phytophthora fragariae TaxID=53985 RepID=A0A6G0MH69_9STRA|nr:hypothetical protein PF004_g28863 [Phytophthora fragariae]
MDQLLLDVGLDANAAVAAITKVLKVGLVMDAAAIMTAELLWNLTHRVLLDVELDAKMVIFKVKQERVTYF